MARKIQRLSTKAINSKIDPGYYPDGAGLYLQVSASKTKSWVFRYMLAGKAREMGLGSLLAVSLAQARAKAADCRNLLANRIDPIEARNAGAAVNALEAAKSITFKDCFAAYIKAHRAEWGREHAEQWEQSIERYAVPVLGGLSVQAVDTAFVLRVLEPIWPKMPQTASRIRARIERVLDWATARGYRTGENPARWRGHMDHLLANVQKLTRVKHFAALPFPDMAEFMALLRAQLSPGAPALEFLILTATRAGEVLGARWSEIDMDGAMWSIPAERMKSGQAHRVPLSQQAMDVLRRMEAVRAPGFEFVFTGKTIHSPLSDATMLALLRRIKAGITVHGFRSTFRDWASERTNFPREVCEMALAHAVGNQVEAAYRRGDLFEKRRQLMDAWATFCELPNTKGEVLTLKRA